MVRISAGTSHKGRAMDTKYSKTTEIPLHTVNIPKDFFIGKFVVPQE